MLVDVKTLPFPQRLEFVGRVWLEFFRWIWFVLDPTTYGQPYTMYFLTKYYIPDVPPNQDVQEQNIQDVRPQTLPIDEEENW